MANEVSNKQAFAALTGSLSVGPWVLKPLCAADSEDLFRHFASPDVTLFMDIDALQTIDEAEEIITWATDIRDRAIGVRWSIRNRANSEFVGTCGFNSIVRERGRRAEIAYDLCPDYWRQGIMSDVVMRLLAFADQDLGLKRVEAMVTPGNTPSCRLLETCGFDKEGTLRQYGFWKGQFWDQMVYGRVTDKCTLWHPIEWDRDATVGT